MDNEVVQKRCTRVHARSRKLDDKLAFPAKKVAYANESYFCRGKVTS